MGRPNQEEVDLHLTPTPPFDFRRTTDVLATFHSSAVTRVVEPGTLRQALWVRGAALLCDVCSIGDLQQPRLEVRLRGPLTPERIAAAEARLRAYLGLDDDLAPFYAVAESDPAFTPVLDRLYGLHLVRFTTPFEAACWALVQQRTPNAFAYRTMARLVELLGDATEADGVRFTTFPGPARLARGARPALLEATNNTRKTDRLEPLGRAFATVEERFLQEASYDEVRAWLLRIPGIGQWSVEYILLRGLGRTERLPWSDTGLQEAVSRTYTRGFLISRGDIRELAERYGWYQGYWLYYLKRSAYRNPQAY